MNILGITSGWESGAALFVDQRLVAAVNEERLSRIKYDPAYPFLSIRWVLDQAGLQPGDVDLVCYGFSRGVGEEALQGLVDAQNGADGAINRERILSEEAVDAPKRVEFLANTRALFGEVPLHWCSHHEAHRAAAFVPSPFDEALVVTADGRGDFVSLTIATANAQGSRVLYQAGSWQSLGYFYGRVTRLCGFTPNRHEGKVTGLAALGNPAKAMGLMKKMIEVTDGQVVAHAGHYYRPFFSNYSMVLVEEAANHTREELAAAAQRHLEEMMLALILPHLRQTGLARVCLAGGVFANIVLNQKIRELAECREVFVYPNMSDGGLCVGAVYDWYWRQGIRPHGEFPTLYQGPVIQAASLAAKLRGAGLTVDEPPDLAGRVAELLARDKMVGLVQGATEFGPRALGHRSVLCSPFDPAQNQRLNQRMRRSEFMPFAPAIAAEWAGECLQDYDPACLSARHMTLSFRVTDAFAANSPAVVHVDGTARPQVVCWEDNPFFHELLHRWRQLTGGLSLLNTSFNFHEEPILASEEDVVQVATTDIVDVLVCPPFIAGADPHG